MTGIGPATFGTTIQCSTTELQSPLPTNQAYLAHFVNQRQKTVAQKQKPEYTTTQKKKYHETTILQMVQRPDLSRDFAAVNKHNFRDGAGECSARFGYPNYPFFGATNI